MPATIALAAFGSRPGPAATQRTRKPARSRNCSSSRGRSEASPIASKPPTSSLVRPSTTMKTGTDSIGANGPAPPPTRCTARMARLPVTCAVNSPPSPRKLMTSTLPAVTLSTVGSSFVPSELSIEGADTQGVWPSAAGDTVADHLPGVDDLIESLLVDITGLKRGLLQGQAFVACLVRDRGGLVVTDHRTERRHQHERTGDHASDAWAVGLHPP